MKLRLIQLLSISLLFGFFAISVSLAFVAVHNLPYALIFGFVNLIGATFPPSKSFIDAPNIFIYLSLTIGIIGNVALTILLTSIFYQIFSKVSISEEISMHKIKGAKNHVIITPINGISLELAKTLSKNKIKYILIDVDRKKVRQTIRDGYVAMAGDASESQVLKKAQIDKASCMISLYDEDLKNAFITIAAKNACSNCSIIAKVRRIEDIPKLQRSGAKQVILPEAAVGEEIADFIVSKY